MIITLRFHPAIINTDDIHSLGIGEHNSVSSGEDNGANNCDAAHFWNSMRHSTTEEATNNFLSRLQTQTGNLNCAGHGYSGMFECGTGQAGTYDGLKQVISWNEFAWAPYFDRLKDKSFSVFSIYSCHTGAGQDGAELLFALATRLNRPVRARTGLTTCGPQSGIGFPDGTWQVAYPGQKPTPISQASVAVEKVFGNMEILILFEAKSSFVLSSLININLTPANGGLTRSYYGTEAQSIAKSIFSSPPYDFGGDLLSIITATITLSFEVDGKPQDVIFDVHNRTVLVYRGNTVGRYIPESLSQII